MARQRTQKARTTSSLPASVTATGSRRAGGTAGMGEVGRSGLQISNGIVLEEFLPQLRGAQGRRVYREMADNEAVIGGFLMAVTHTIGRLPWKVDVAEDSDDDDKAARDFIEECREDMSGDWTSTLADIMSMLTYGWSYLEIVYKRRQGPNDKPGLNSNHDDGRIGWRKWAPRAQESLMYWLMDEEGGIQGMHQTTLTGPYDIPIEKSLLFRPNTASSNPEGRSMLRNAYRPWYFKKRIEELEAVGIERDLAGLPVVEMHPKYFSANASPDQKALLAAMTQLVQSVKRNELEGALIPVEYDEKGNKSINFELMSSGGARQFNTDAIIGRYSQQIAMSVLADFLMLGHENVGSQSLGVSKIELWMMAVEAIAKSIADVINTHAIPRLLKLNGMDTTNPPKLTFGTVENVDLIAMSSYLKNLTDAGILVPDEGIEEHVRQIADLPPINKDQRDEIYGEDGYTYGANPPVATGPSNADIVNQQLDAAMQPPPGGPITPAKNGQLPTAPAGDGLPDVPGVTPKAGTSAKPRP